MSLKLSCYYHFFPLFQFDVVFLYLCCYSSALLLVFLSLNSSFGCSPMPLPAPNVVFSNNYIHLGGVLLIYSCSWCSILCLRIEIEIHEITYTQMNLFYAFLISSDFLLSILILHILQSAWNWLIFGGYWWDGSNRIRNGDWRWSPETYGKTPGISKNGVIMKSLWQIKVTPS